MRFSPHSFLCAVDKCVVWLSFNYLSLYCCHSLFEEKRFAFPAMDCVKSSGMWISPRALRLFKASEMAALLLPVFDIKVR